MARRLDEFPAQLKRGQQTYPWHEWADGSVWEIRRGVDYDVATETMRVNLHMRATTLSRKVRTHKVVDERGEGLVFQFLESREMETVRMSAANEPAHTRTAIEQLHSDAVEIYERARKEVTIERSDGRRQKYAAVRFKQQIEQGYENDELVPVVARIIRKPTLGFGHLEAAERPDLMLETLVLDESKPYHHLFTPRTVQTARARMDEYRERHS
jgi:uncharacterized protein (DUF885 family)